ncbi:hypothetical protein AK88_01949 [Plasmodium fragile]|uniref:Uncharacterized protein n=1 Tax=Plasmodium fragile TaxID=5857 RepID=A0A0D9QN31_PLAFR|nr:uncharacterized protein AK88_01949 [Plasmodium fragile]KJP88333.1 hypothetical protein AK88_01949 [Plasmodium fragile]
MRTLEHYNFLNGPYGYSVGNSMPWEKVETVYSEFESEGLLPWLPDEAPNEKIRRKPKGFLSVLKHTIIANKIWMSFTVATVVYCIIMLGVYIALSDTTFIVTSLALLAGGIGIMLQILLLRLYSRRTKSKMLDKIWRCRIFSRGNRKQK